MTDVAAPSSSPPPVSSDDSKHSQPNHQSSPKVDSSSTNNIIPTVETKVLTNTMNETPQPNSNISQTNPTNKLDNKNNLITNHVDDDSSSPKNVVTHSASDTNSTTNVQNNIPPSSNSQTLIIEAKSQPVINMNDTPSSQNNPSSNVKDEENIKQIAENPSTTQLPDNTDSNSQAVSSTLPTNDNDTSSLQKNENEKQIESSPKPSTDPSTTVSLPNPTSSPFQPKSSSPTVNNHTDVPKSSQSLPLVSSNQNDELNKSILSTTPVKDNDAIPNQPNPTQIPTSTLVSNEHTQNPSPPTQTNMVPNTQMQPTSSVPNTTGTYVPDQPVPQVPNPTSTNMIPVPAINRASQNNFPLQNIRRPMQDMRKNNRRGFIPRAPVIVTEFPFPKNLPKMVKNRPPNSRVFIGNLASEHTSTHEIISLFHKYGTLIEEPVLRRSFGFVQYSCAEEARAAVEGEHGNLIGGLPMDLSIADNREVKKFTHVQNNTPFPQTKGNGNGPSQHGQSRRRERDLGQPANQPLPKRRRRSLSPPPGKKGGVHPPQYRRQRPEPRNGVYMRILCMSPTAEKYARHCENTFRSMTALHADVVNIVATGLGDALGRAMRESIPYVMVVASKDVDDGTCTIRTLEKTGYEKCGRGNGVISLREAVEVCLIERGIMVPPAGVNNHFNNAPSHHPPQAYYQPYGHGVGHGNMPSRMNSMQNNANRGPMSNTNANNSTNWLSHGMNHGGMDRPAWMSGPRASNTASNNRGPNNIPPIAAPPSMHNVPNSLGSRNNMPASNPMIHNGSGMNNSTQYVGNANNNAGYQSGMNVGRGGYGSHQTSAYVGNNSNHMGPSRIDDPSRGSGYDSSSMQQPIGNNTAGGHVNDYGVAGNMGVAGNSMNVQSGYMDRYNGNMPQGQNMGHRGNYNGRDEYDPTAPTVIAHGGRQTYNGVNDGSQMDAWGRPTGGTSGYDSGRTNDNNGVMMGSDGYHDNYSNTQHPSQHQQQGGYNDQRGTYNRPYDRRGYGQGQSNHQTGMMNNINSNNGNRGYEGGFQRANPQGYTNNNGRWGDTTYGGMNNSMQPQSARQPASDANNNNGAAPGTVDIGKLTHLISAFQQKQQQAQATPQNYHPQGQGAPPPPPPPHSNPPYPQRHPYSHPQGRNMNRWNGR